MKRSYTMPDLSPIIDHPVQDNAVSLVEGNQKFISRKMLSITMQSINQLKKLLIFVNIESLHDTQIVEMSDATIQSSQSDPLNLSRDNVLISGRGNIC